MLAPLQFVGYDVDGLHIKPLERGYKTDTGDVPSRMGIVLELSMEYEPDPETNAHTLGLRISFNENLSELTDEQRDALFYTGYIRISGRFVWIGDEPMDGETTELLLVNGMSMLYGVARVHLAQLTGRGQRPRLFIPTISLMPVVREWLEEETTE